jgi:hypothetical protein
MFDVSKIKNSLSGIIGFKQPFNPDYAILNASNQLSESGYFVNSNPFAKIEYIKDCQDYAGISDENFNVVLSDIIENSAINVVNQVFSESSYIDRQVLYKYAYNKIETNPLPNGFVGYRIEVDDTKSIAFKITRVLLDFQGTGTIKLLLFNSAKLEPIREQEVTITTDHQEVVLDWVLNDTDTIYKGDYFFGYIKGDTTTVTPYKRSYENSEIMSYITHLNIEEIFIPNHSNETLFDISKSYSYDESSGLNPDITVYDDFTDLIIQNRFLFSRAIFLSAVINCLQIYMSSLRSNRNERQADELYKKILLEIEGMKGNEGSISVKGLRPQLLSEISQIKTEIQSIKEGYLGNGYEVITEM